MVGDSEVATSVFGEQSIGEVRPHEGSREWVVFMQEHASYSTYRKTLAWPGDLLVRHMGYRAFRLQ